jgi:hypothetical protein
MDSAIEYKPSGLCHDVNSFVISYLLERNLSQHERSCDHFDGLPSERRNWDPELGLDGLWKSQDDLTAPFLSFLNLIKPDAFHDSDRAILSTLRQRLDDFLRKFLGEPSLLGGH